MTGTRKRCRACGQLIQWVENPTGGWWAHDIHPGDGHDADTDTRFCAMCVDGVVDRDDTSLCGRCCQVAYIGIGVGAVTNVEVCGGCRVPGFGEHRCYGEVVHVKAVGQAVIHDCACAVDLGCAGHKAAGTAPPAAQAAPFGYGVKR